MNRSFPVILMLVVNSLIGNDTIPPNISGEQRLLLLNEYSARYLQQNPQLAREYALKARDLAGVLNNFEELANALNYLALTYYNQGDYEEAIAVYQQAIKAALRTGSKAQVANLFHKIGMAYLQQKNYPKAIFYYQQAVRVYEQLGYIDYLARGNYQLGIVYYLSNDFNQALVALEQALDQFSQVDDKRGRAKVLVQLAMTYEAIGNLKKALILYQEALQIHKVFNNRDNMAYILNNIGVVYSKLRLYDEAKNALSQALSLSEADFWELQATVHTNLGKVLLAEDKLKEAEAEFSNALLLIDRVQSREIKADLYQSLYELYLKKNDTRKALEFYRLYIEFRTEKGSIAGVIPAKGEPCQDSSKLMWIVLGLSIVINLVLMVALIRLKFKNAKLTDLLIENNILRGAK